MPRPGTEWSSGWGYYPVGGVGLLLAILIAILIMKGDMTPSFTIHVHLDPALTLRRYHLLGEPMPF